MCQASAPGGQRHQARSPGRPYVRVSEVNPFQFNTVRLGCIVFCFNPMSTWFELKDNLRLKKIFEQRMEITRLIREFFWQQGFVEPETPIAVKTPSQEPYLNFIPLEFHGPIGEKHKMYLQTSPEFAMKKLLAAGWGKIFQLCKCFRDFEEFGGRHNTEFTMIEWYRAPGGFADIMDDTEKLFKFVGDRLDISKISYQGKEIDIKNRWNRWSMKEVWEKFVGINLDEYLTAEKMVLLARERGFKCEAGEPYEDVFYKIFLNEIEPKLGNDVPVFIYDYPAQMASLSRLCSDARYAERFELYIGGLELCNAFGELTDAEDQKQRLDADRKQRMALGKDTWPVDESFIDALKSGIPTAAGIALGVDRMVLLFTEARDLNEVIFQSVKDQI